MILTTKQILNNTLKIYETKLENLNQNINDTWHENDQTKTLSLMTQRDVIKTLILELKLSILRIGVFNYE